jgi:hypothetical protein
MSKILDIVLIIGFVIADFFMFHDAMSQANTMVEYLVGVLSIIVIVRSARALLKK